MIKSRGENKSRPYFVFISVGIRLKSNIDSTDTRCLADSSAL